VGAEDEPLLHKGNHFSMGTENITLQALYAEPARTLGLTFMQNANSDDSLNAEWSVKQAYTVILPTDLDLEFEKLGYRFVGWNTEADGSGSSYEGKNEYTVFRPYGDRVFYAVWAANSYAVSYDANTGEGLMDGDIVTYDNELSLKTNSFTKEGYVFTGWNTAVDGGGESYADEYQFKPWQRTEDLVLYAQWQEVVTPPVDPEEPTTPEEPTVPEEPVTPEEPTSPEEPAVPEEPTTPEEPTVPEEPIDPEKPLVPGEPTTPEDPIDPDEPAAPEEPVDTDESTSAPDAPTRFITDTSAQDTSLVAEPNVPLIAGVETAQPPVSDGDISTTRIVEGAIPLIVGEASSTWALVNLILALIGVVAAFVTTIFWLFGRRQNEEREAKRARQHAENEESDTKGRRKAGLAVTLILAVVGIAFFFLTENIALPMVLVDRWTVVNAIILLLEMVGVFFALKRPARDEDDNGDKVILYV
jgi:uncharacterized repeat protein (TIGR02543 family)